MAIPPITIDPHIVPWSFRGSYLCLATRAGEGGRLTPANNDICLVSHIYPAGLPLFALRPNLSGPPTSSPSGFHKDPSPVHFQATPGCMTWTHKDQIIAEATFQDVRTIRMRGTGSFSFDTEGKLAVDAWRTWLFRVPGNKGREVEFTSRPDSALRFIAHKGEFTLGNEAPSGDDNRRITISPSEGSSTWELEIVERERERVSLGDEAEGGNKKGGEVTFDEVRDRMAGTFESYARDMCPWQDDWGSKEGQTDQLGAYVMWTSTVRAAGYFKKEAVLMSKLWMNKVWSWDNCFNCLALAIAYPDTAIDQMLLPFDWITPEGRLPDSMCHSEILYDYTKPPIYGWVLFKLLGILSTTSSVTTSKKAEDGGSIYDSMTTERLTDIYGKVRLNTMFWYTARKADGLQIPWYSHGNDSGWDNATCFDRQTMVASPDLAGFLIAQNDFLAQTAKFLGKSAEATEWEKKKDDMIGALLELWDDENKTFNFQDAFDQSTWSTSTLLKYIPLVASSYLPKNVVFGMVEGLKAHMTEYGLATESPTSPKYESDGYWRGPIWAPPTIIIESGLREAGYTELADEISGKYRMLCGKSGFAENYDAVTGFGNRDLSYTWSASTYLVLRREQMGRELP